MSEQKSDLLCNKLAITISPYDDELFSSWIFRLALANAIEPYYLHKFVTNNARSWNMDLDVARDEDIIDCYCLKTGYSKSKIRKLLLHDLLERLAVKKTDKTNSRWLIPLNNRSRNLTAPGGILFCPSCLIKYGYFRQHWRLATTTICLEHMIYLKEHCQRCCTPVRLKYVYSDLRDSLDSESIMYCIKCRFDLRQSARHRAKPWSIHHSVVNSGIINRGFIDLPSKMIGFSHLYFEVVSVLSCVLLFRKTGILLYHYLKHRLGIKYERWELVSQNMKTIENISLNSRDIILYMIDWLLDDFPIRFNQVISESKVMPSILHMSRDYRPYWFNSVLKLIKNNK